MVDGNRVRQVEEQWRGASDPRSLLTAYHAALEATQPGCPSARTARKWRLAAVACCRTLWPLLVEAEAVEARRAVEVAEAEADGEAADGDLHEAGEAIRKGREEGRGLCWLDDSSTVGLVCGPLDYAEFAAFGLTDADPAVAAVDACYWATRCFARDRRLAPRQPVLLRLLRDILGNPFHPVALDGGWLHDPVRPLALAMYREQRFEDLPVLADALEEAGCTDAGILRHLRGPGPHARGCWVLDALVRPA